MKYYLRVLRYLLAAEGLPPRCHKCRRYCLKGWASDMNAPIERPVHRCYPACETR